MVRLQVRVGTGPTAGCGEKAVAFRDRTAVSEIMRPFRGGLAISHDNASVLQGCQGPSRVRFTPH
jgi:hypothetical protein